MAANYDIKLLNNEPVISSGDFVIAQSDEQHIADTLNAFPGWWKEYPDDGVGVRAYLGGPVNTQLLAKNIQLQLSSDGYTVNGPLVSIDASGNLVIEPNATI